MNRKEGDVVRFKLGGDERFIVTGRIVGMAAMPQAVIGTNWIVKTEAQIQGWPFSCVTCFEVHIVE